MSPELGPVLAFAGSLLLALAGALIGHYFTRNREMEKFRKDRVTQAYAAISTPSRAIPGRDPLTR